MAWDSHFEYVHLDLCSTQRLVYPLSRAWFGITCRIDFDLDFAKKNANLEIKAGMMDGRILSAEQLAILAELPSREVLIGKLLSLMIAMQTSLVNVLSAVPRNFVQVLDAYREKKASEN